jgi:hypothetical protein
MYSAPPFAQSIAALHSSFTLPSRSAWAPPRRQGRHNRQGSLCVRADLFGGVARFFGASKDDSPAHDSPLKLSSSTAEDVRRLVQEFNTSETAPRLALSQEEVQLRISALLNGADSDAARKAKSASAVLESLAGGGTGNRLAFAAAQDELRWSQAYTTTLDTNQARAEALVRQRLGLRLARRAGPRVLAVSPDAFFLWRPAPCQIRGFSEADVQGLISRFVDASLSLSERTTSRVLSSSPSPDGPALLTTTAQVVHRRSVTAHAVGTTTRDGITRVVDVGGWIDSDSRMWDTLDAEADEVGRLGAGMAQLPTA